MTNALDVADRIVDLTDSESAHAAARWVRPALLWFAGWTAGVVVMAGIVSTQKHVPLAYALRSEAINYYTLAAANLVVWFAAAAMTARRWPAARQTAAHLVLGVALIALWQAAYAAYMWSVMGPLVWDRLYSGTWMFQVMNACVLYGGVLGGTLAVQSARRARAHERRQHALALAAREAELRALNAQLEPHFLLNTLNSVLALVDTSPRDARLMIERLSELLKAAFDELEEADVPLARELELVEAYLGIEQVRFGDRLRVAVDVPEALRTVRVPPFLLQPIVENAIKHGVAPVSGPAFITIAARRVDGAVRIEVIDSGRGFSDAGGSRRGRGLTLTARRLQAYAPLGTLHVEPATGGFAVVITLPA
jgi:two-component system, LytTR family, sensor kinase